VCRLSINQIHANSQLKKINNCEKLRKYVILYLVITNNNEILRKREATLHEDIELKPGIYTYFGRQSQAKKQAGGSAHGHSLL
jgi:hypothetical protein